MEYYEQLTFTGKGDVEEAEETAYEKYGLKRCGCIMCCMADSKERQKAAKLFPKYAENLRLLCHRIIKARTRNESDITGDELYEIYLR